MTARSRRSKAWKREKAQLRKNIKERPQPKPVELVADELNEEKKDQ